MRRKALCFALCVALAAGFSCQFVSAAPGDGPDQAQRAERRQKLLEKFDKNGNGQLDPDEKEAAKQAMQNRREQGGGGKGPGGRGGQDPERRRKFMEKFDTDGDGKLSDTERAAAKEAREKRGK